MYDDGYGIYIGNADTSVEEPLYTAELLQKTILDPETGYNSHPQVVSGPYVMTSFDGETARFEKNPYFKGAFYQGVLPEGVEQMAVVYEAMLDEANGALAQLEGALDRFEAAQPQLKALAAYYTSKTWQRDYAADEGGRLPADLKRGVLSEDGINDTLDRAAELKERLSRLRP